jgi:hypothetical protein
MSPVSSRTGIVSLEHYLNKQPTVREPHQVAKHLLSAHVMVLLVVLVSPNKLIDTSHRRAVLSLATQQMGRSTERAAFYSREEY